MDEGAAASKDATRVNKSEPLEEYIVIDAVERAKTLQQDAAKKKAKRSTDKEIEALGKRPYWMSRCRNIQSPFLRLHQGEC